MNTLLTVKNEVLSPDVAKAFEIARINHWRFRVADGFPAGWGLEMPPEAPVMAQDRLSALKRAGIHVKEVWVAHEPVRPEDDPDFKIREILTGIGNGVKAIGKVGAVAIPILAVVGVALVAAPVVLLLVAGKIDPIVYAVLDDGTILEVLRWDE